MGWKWDGMEWNGEWNDENSGGGDILGLNWRKNPQYLFTLTKTSDVCTVLKQGENSMSMGFYIVKLVDAGKKVIEYEQEVAKTDSFKTLCSTGVQLPKLPEGQYVIIASTYESGGKGRYQLIVYSDDPNSTVTPLTTEWKVKKEIKGEWLDKTAGGSPNNATFTDNPQYKLAFPPVDHPIDIIVQLIQESSHIPEGIGFLVLKRSDDGNSKLTNVSNDDVRAKPDGWIQKHDVIARFTILPDEPRIYTIIPSTFKPEVNKSFTWNVFSEDDVTIELIQ